jgi:hypothetical protein
MGLAGDPLRFSSGSFFRANQKNLERTQFGRLTRKCKTNPAGALNPNKSKPLTLDKNEPGRQPAFVIGILEANGGSAGKSVYGVL